MFISFIGPPGSGKGTQAGVLSKYLGLPHISTGDLLRKEIHSRTDIGIEINEQIINNRSIKLRKETILMFEEYATSVIRNRLEEFDCRDGAIIDGFPRTIKQANSINELTGNKLEKVIHLYCQNENLLVKRIMGRLVCLNCGGIFNTKLNIKTEDLSRCSYCENQLSKRYEDKKDLISNRIQEYNTVTIELIDYFRKQDLLIEVSAIGEIDYISEKILSHFQRR